MWSRNKCLGQEWKEKTLLEEFLLGAEQKVCICAWLSLNSPSLPKHNQDILLVEKEKPHPPLALQLMG